MAKKSKYTASAVIVAAGDSRRMGGKINKQLLLIDDIPVLARTLLNFSCASSITDIVVVTKQENIVLVNDLIREFDISKVRAIVPGGKTRQESVTLGLKELQNSSFVAVHDGARPFATPSLIDKLVEDAYTYGSAAPGVIPKDTIKSVNSDDFVEATPDRNSLRLIQTPQVFRVDELKLAYIRAEEAGFMGTDDCSVIENMGKSVHISPGEYTNIKVTTPEDLPVAEAICKYLK